MKKKKKKRGGGGVRTSNALWRNDVPDFHTNRIITNQDISVSACLGRHARDLSAIRHACAYISHHDPTIPTNTSLPHTHTQTNQPSAP